MDAHVKAAAIECSKSSEENRMSFPQVVMTLTEAGVESYFADFRRSAKTYYLPNGESLEVAAETVATPMGSTFDVSAVQAAIREAQANGPGYTYRGFGEKVVAAGCVGYIVSIVGRRAVYFGRTGETHVEHFPSAP